MKTFINIWVPQEQNKDTNNYYYSDYDFLKNMIMKKIL